MSIEAKELRIGNLVKINDLFIRVHKIEEDRFWTTHNNLLFFQGQDTIPIPLTEDILLKCGFIQSSNNWGNTFHILEKNGFIVMFTIEHWTDTDVNSKYHNYWHCKYLLNGNQLKYLHQLQNLYFALTGSELEVNL